MNSLSFNKGLREVEHGKIPVIRKELTNALGISCRQAFYKYRDGKAKNLSVINKEVIERIFKAYGVSDPWGE